MKTSCAMSAAIIAHVTPEAAAQRAASSVARSVRARDAIGLSALSAISRPCRASVVRNQPVNRTDSPNSLLVRSSLITGFAPMISMSSSVRIFCLAKMSARMAAHRRRCCSDRTRSTTRVRIRCDHLVQRLVQERHRERSSSPARAPRSPRPGGRDTSGEVLDAAGRDDAHLDLVRPSYCSGSLTVSASASNSVQGWPFDRHRLDLDRCPAAGCPARRAGSGP